MKIAFMGSSSFSAIICEHILNSGYEISTIYTRAPKPKGRGKQLHITELHQLALKKNIAIQTPKTFKNIDNQEEFKTHNFDVAIVASYGLILPLSVLNAPKYGCINIHASILPFYRGSSPIHMAIANGEIKTGITIMQMDEGLDSGDIIDIQTIEILQDTYFEELHNNLAHISCPLIIKTLNKLKNNELLIKTPQDHSLATFTKILQKEDGIINFNNNITNVYNQIRAFSLYPSAYFYYKNELIKIIKAQPHFVKDSHKEGTIISLQPLMISCKNGLLEIIELQRQGKNVLKAKDFLNGFKLNLNDIIQ